jgi:peptidyl-dipeptidase Dcp
MVRHLALILAGAVAFGTLSISSWSTEPMTLQTSTQAAGRANPLLTPSTLPFGVPPFDTIRDTDFPPAFEAGMKAQLAEIDAIAGSPAPPTFENTLVALEQSGQLLGRVGPVFNGLTSANTNPELQKIQQDVAPKLAAHDDAIFLNGKLFARVEAVYRQREALKLDPESRHSTNRTPRSAPRT